MDTVTSRTPTARSRSSTPAGWSSSTRGSRRSPRSTATARGFDARELTTRQINLELRWLLYEQGVTEVTVPNPGARHSLGVGILTRCRITFEGSLGYFALRHDRRARGPHRRPRRLVGVREHDVRAWS